MKAEGGETQQIIVSSLRDGPLTLKRAVLEIFHEYFLIEHHKAEILEGKEKDPTIREGVPIGMPLSIGVEEWVLLNGV